MLVTFSGGAKVFLFHRLLGRFERNYEETGKDLEDTETGYKDTGPEFGQKIPGIRSVCKAATFLSSLCVQYVLQQRHPQKHGDEYSE